MPAHGGLTPGFERYGGGAPGLKRILESLNAARGSAYDTSATSTVYAENLAIARAIAESWSTNARMANQWDTARMTDFIPRWEKIYGLYPLPSDTPTDRRKRIAAAAARVGKQPNYQYAFDLVKAALGACFVSILHTPSTDPHAIVIWPGAGNTTPTVAWYSSVAYVAVLVQQPAGMNDGAFYGTVGQIYPILDGILPAWVTFDWIRRDIHGGGVAGFWLDDANDLDNEGFD